MSLTFTESSHRYRLDGKFVQGVTTIINQGMPKDLRRHYAKSVATFVTDNPLKVDSLRDLGRAPMIEALTAVPFEFLDTAAFKGSEVHALAEILATGAVVEVPTQYEGYVEGVVEFLNDWEPEPLIIERPLANRTDWWAGKPDMFAALPDGRTILFDYKTTRSGIWPETAFQLAAYRRAEFYLADDGTEQPIPPVDLCAAVWLTPDGYHVIPVQADDQTYREFLAIKTVAEAAKVAKRTKTSLGYVGLPLDPPDYLKEAV